jgi:ATHILA ORF-1 family
MVENLMKGTTWMISKDLVIELHGYKEYRARSIKHSVIRCIQRALAQMIFTHEENIDEVTTDEMKLLDQMLASARSDAPHGVPLDEDSR